MLWPEGAPHRLAPLGKYIDPKIEGERVKSVSISSAGSYLAVVSEHILALMRIKPLSPVAIYAGLNSNNSVYKSVTASWSGMLIAVLSTDNSVEIYKVQPQTNLEEVLKATHTVVSGPGEAIGVREIYLTKVCRLTLDFEVVSIRAVGSQGFVVVGPTHYQVWTPSSEKFVSGSRTLLEGDEEYRSIFSLGVATFGLITSRGRIMISSVVNAMSSDNSDPSHENDSNKSIRTALQPQFSNIKFADYNSRMGKLVLITEDNRVKISSLDPKDDSVPLPDVTISSRVFTCARWTAAGTCLVLGHNEGWTVLSMLGTQLYDSEARDRVDQVEWAGDSLLTVSTGYIYQHSLLLWALASGSNGSRPVLHGSGRLMLYHDHPSVHASPWLTIPLPLWYMASNWPLNFAVASDDGKMVAVAGSVGMMYFSTLNRQWREVGERDSSIRGGIVWHGRRLIAASYTRGEGYMLKMYSAFRAAGASLSSDGLGGGSDSEQIIAYEKLGTSPPIALSLTNGILGVLIDSTMPYMKLYSVQSHDFDPIRELPLGGILPSAPRALTVLDHRRVLFLVGSRLVLLSLVEGEDNNQYRRQTIAEPIETYFYHSSEQVLWVWDGQEVVVTSLRNAGQEGNGLSLANLNGGSIPNGEAFSAEKNNILARIPLDSYPVYVSLSRGVLALIESEPVKSYDGSFWSAKPVTALEVYVPWLLESALGNPLQLQQLARRYMKLPYFDRVLETLLYRVMTKETNSRDLPAAIDLLSAPPFLDHKLPVIASCARKVEMTYWPKLFEVLNADPAELFDDSLVQGDLETASEFLLVVQAYEGGDAGGTRAQALYKAALKAGDLRICRELCEFLVAVDPTGVTLKEFALRILPSKESTPTIGSSNHAK